MVESIEISEAGAVTVGVLLTVAGCPLKDTITANARREVGGVEGVTEACVFFLLKAAIRLLQLHWQNENTLI